MSPPRIAMWSGPRNLSTALMRSFGNRSDTTVVDEPFYAAYLEETGLAHPMREAVLVGQPTDPAEVARALDAPRTVMVYEKHMTHHMTPAIRARLAEDRLAEDWLAEDWLAGARHAFLIRDPSAVLASYAARHDAVSLEAIGLPAQVDLFDRVRATTGVAPPVIASEALLADPAGTLRRLCARLEIAFDAAMLSWPPGSRETDGVWAPAWYDAVIRSTGFAEPSPPVTKAALPGDLRTIAEAARPFHARLAAHAL